MTYANFSYFFYQNILYFDFFVVILQSQTTDFDPQTHSNCEKVS